MFILKHTFIFVVSALLFFISFHLPAEDVAWRTVTHFNFAQKQEHALQWARDHLPQTGVLTEKNDGFVYLKVDDRYINQLLFRLPYHQYAMPPYFRRPNAPGAHISVFYTDERNQTGKISEIGQKYSFKITGIALVPPKSHEYLVLEVEAPDLEQLRKKYGLSPLLKGHKFHITVGKKKRGY